MKYYIGTIKSNEKGFMAEFVNLEGITFGSWHVIKLSRLYNGRALWLCKCKCGIEKEVISNNLLNGRSKSCGGRKSIKIKSISKPIKAKHRMSRSKTYRTWQAMKARCDNPKQKNYSYYGGRGIKYCISWQIFKSFMDDMGLRPEGYQLDRIDFNKGYSKENCRWATKIEQANNRRNNVKIQYRGQLLSIIQIAKINKVDAINLKYRVFVKKMSIEQGIMDLKNK